MASRGGHRAAVVVAAIAVGAAGCGGDDGPSKEQFVANANAICKRHYVTISAAASKLLAGGRLPSPRQFGKLAQETILPQYTAQIAELRAVKPSEAQAAAYRAWLDDSEALKARLMRNPALIQDAKALAAVNGQADALGLSSNCHVGPS